MVEFSKIVDGERVFGFESSFLFVLFQGRRSGLGEQACTSKPGASEPFPSWGRKVPLSTRAGPRGLRISVLTLLPKAPRSQNSISSDP